MTEPYKTDTISADEALMSIKTETDKNMSDFIRIHGFYDNPTYIIKKSEIQWIMPFKDEGYKRVGAEITFENGKKVKAAESVDKIWEMLKS